MDLNKQCFNFQAGGCRQRGQERNLLAAGVGLDTVKVKPSRVALPNFTFTGAMSCVDNTLVLYVEGWYNRYKIQTIRSTAQPNISLYFPKCSSANHNHGYIILPSNYPRPGRGVNPLRTGTLLRTFLHHNLRAGGRALFRAPPRPQVTTGNFAGLTLPYCLGFDSASRFQHSRAFLASSTCI
jgi:hypothetical protein